FDSVTVLCQYKHVKRECLNNVHAPFLLSVIDARALN
ncbi:MAG: hypothetical protein ACI90R_001921, partial [Alteromonas macleodii]